MAFLNVASSQTLIAPSRYNLSPKNGRGGISWSLPGRWVLWESLHTSPNARESACVPSISSCKRKWKKFGTIIIVITYIICWALRSRGGGGGGAGNVNIRKRESRCITTPLTASLFFVRVQCGMARIRIRGGSEADPEIQLTTPQSFSYFIPGAP